MLEVTAPVAAAAAAASGRVEVAPLEDVGRRQRGHPLLHRHRGLPPLPRRGRRRRHQAAAAAAGLRGRGQQGGLCKNILVICIVVMRMVSMGEITRNPFSI